MLDEPLAGLHGALRTDIAGQLVDIARRRSAAILLSGHDTTLVHSIADQVVELGAVADLPTAPATWPPLAQAPSNDLSAEGRAAKLRTEIGMPTMASGDSDEFAPGSPTIAPPERASEAAVLLDADSETGDHGRIGADVQSVVSGGRMRADVAYPVEPGSIEFDRERAAEPAWNGHRDSSDAVLEDGPARDEFVLRARGISASVDGHQVLADIDFELFGGAALAVVGASGAGKTTLARVVAGLHRCATGYLYLRDAPISVGRGRRIPYGAGGIQLVTQNPRSALNPRRTVAQTLGRPLRRIGRVPKHQLPRRITELLASVELSADLSARYPHELSGGQRQRIAVARALAAEPAVLLCDEITSALDHATATSIMALLDRIRAESDTALLVITHDMALVAERCSRLLVLDHGRIVESGKAGTVLAAPIHTATRELLG